MIYTKFKREKYSKCNICLKESEMTFDHIPPRGSIEIQPVEQENIFHRLTQNQRKFNLSQNGVKFRTICSVCNNERLGAELDPVLNEFTKSVSLVLKSKLTFPQYIEIETQPNLLIRAILGHLLAAKIKIDDSVIDKSIRDFVFDYNIPIPNDINIFYWIYPFQEIEIMRDFGMPSIRNKFKDIGLFSILKFFPVAYLISDLNEYENLPSLISYKTKNFEDKSNITIDLKKIKPQFWPNNIENGNFMIGGARFDSSVIASPRKKG